MPPMASATSARWAWPPPPGRRAPPPATVPPPPPSSSVRVSRILIGSVYLRWYTRLVVSGRGRSHSSAMRRSISSTTAGSPLTVTAFCCTLTVMRSSTAGASASPPARGVACWAWRARRRCSGVSRPRACAPAPDERVADVCVPASSNRSRMFWAISFASACARRNVCVLTST